MDETEILQRTYKNMRQIDRFFNGSEYQCLIDMSIAAPTDSRQTAELILNKVDLLDASIEFFTDKKEWQRCYAESAELVSVLRDYIDDKYNPV